MIHHYHTCTRTSTQARQARLPKKYSAHHLPVTFFILCVAWLLHPAFLQDRNTPYLLTYQVLKFQIISNFPSTLRLTVLNNPIMAILPRNGTNAKPPPASSKGKSKTKIVLKPKDNPKPPSVTITDMLVETRLTNKGFFEVQLQDPSLISPSNAG